MFPQRVSVCCPLPSRVAIARRYFGATKPVHPTFAPSPRRRPGRAFTLIELLAVLAITGLLVSLLFPNLKQMILKSQMAASASNLRQISTAMALYEAEIGRLPQAVGAPDPIGPGTVTWDRALLDSGYLSDSGKAVFKAPGDNIARTDRGDPRSYAANDFVLYQPTSPLNGIDGRWLRSTKGRSRVVVLFERPTNVNSYGSTGSCAFHSPSPNGWYGPPSPNYIFRTGGNYLFGDGHVEFLDLHNYGASPSEADANMKTQLFTP